MLSLVSHVRSSKAKARQRATARRASIERLEERTVLSGWLANSFGDASSSSEGRDIAVDGAGNVLVTGSFQGTMNLSPTTALTSNAGSVDAFVAKYSPDGQLLWGRRMGGPGEDRGGKIGGGMAVNAAGEVYVAGYFRGSADFGSTSLTSAGYADVFLTKLDPEGNFLWALRAGGPDAPVSAGDAENDDVARGVVLGSDGEIYLAGTFHGTADFGTFSRTSVAGTTDAFLAKLTESNNVPVFQWVNAVGTASYDSARALAIGASAGAADSIYLAYVEFPSYRVVAKYSPDGTAGWTARFDGWNFFPMTVYQADDTTHHIYVGIGDSTGDTLAKLDSASGSVQWQLAPQGDFYVWDLAADSTGVYATGGWLENTVDFDPSPDHSALLTPYPGGYDGFIWNLDHAGNFLAARRFGSADSSNYDRGSGIALHEGDIYTTGNFLLAAAQFDIGTAFVSPASATGSGKMFVVKTTQDRSAVFGKVFNDLNGDGIQNDSYPGILDPALPGVTVSLGGGLEDMTEKNGEYVVNHLSPGNYSAQLVLPTGWTQTSPANSGTHSVALQPGVFADTCDFGAHQPSAFHTYASTDVPKRFPNRPWQTTESKLTIADSYSIFDVEINIAATANPNSLTLVAPDGTTANVTAGAPLHLTAFNYKDVKGTWTLRITSGSVAVSGSVTAWSLKVLGPQTAVPVPSLSIADVSKSEGNSGTTAFSFTVALSSASANSVTVQYATANGTATAGSDYTAAGGTLTIPAGTLSATITVPVIGDTLKETNETFSVNLSSPAGATIADGQGLGTIVNDDGKPKTAAVAAAVPVEAAGDTAAQTGSGSVAGAAAARYQQPVTIAAATQPADLAVPTVSGGGQRLDVRAREREQRAVDGVFQDLDTDLLADFQT